MIFSTRFYPLNRNPDGTYFIFEADVDPLVGPWLVHLGIHARKVVFVPLAVRLLRWVFLWEVFILAGDDSDGAVCPATAQK